MSVFCRVSHPHLLLKSLAVLTVARDAWATVAFADHLVVLHVEGAERSLTATATLPAAMFAEYSATSVRLGVHLASLRDALLLGGPAPLASASHARLTLAYPVGDARLLVELTDGDGTLQSTLVTRPVRDRLLDLRFGDAPVVSRVTLLGDFARDLIEDLVVAQCPHAVVVLDPNEGVILRGEGGPYGTVALQMMQHSEAILSPLTECTHAQTRVLQSHLALACGVRSGGKLWRAAGAPSDTPLGFVANSSSGSGPQPTFGGFERLLFQINEECQLCVVHMPRDHDIAVTVTVVISPLCDIYDD